MTRLVLTTPSQHLLKDRMKRTQEEKDAERAARAENARLTEKYKYVSPGWKKMALVSAGFFVMFFLMVMSVRTDDYLSATDNHEIISCTTKLLERGAKIDFGSKNIVDLAWHSETGPAPLLSRIPFCLLVALLLTIPIAAIIKYTDKFMARHNYLYVRSVTLQKCNGQKANAGYGFNMTHRGCINEVATGGPADGLIELDETVLAINGVRLCEYFNGSTIRELLEARQGSVELHVRETKTQYWSALY
ncbi:hypothetical protein PMAYCL1PPCAC_09934 [Pristionchus mayeri]|uniref:PDZ domain-containing protein n=1 Tax=Pristionchus mayeri TaxID=1317129 RepID=A0AAN5CEC2_9BILA|nr:hypothetical protein PMAYCL1PPCAC_09934 [Pristionchus mayeri]